MKKILISLVTSIALFGGAVAQAAPEERLMPDVHLFLPSEEAFPLSEFLPARRWVLLVVDASLPAGRACLDALTSKQDGFGENLWIVVVGNAKELQQQIKGYDKLAGARWLRADSALLSQLHLSGTPAMLGMTAGRQIAWQHAGIPHAPEQLPLMVKNWIGQSGTLSSSGINQ